MGIRELLTSELQNAQQLRHLQVEFDEKRCIACWQCYEVCPVGRWTPDREARIARFSDPEDCVACGACVLQCPEDAIRLTVHKG